MTLAKSPPQNEPNWSDQIRKGRRFRFGRNWKNYSLKLNADRIEIASGGLTSFLTESMLRDKMFLDAGSGSGVHSLAALKMNARVWAFDYDTDSVECTQQTLAKHSAQFSGDFRVLQGSVLDKNFLNGLPLFDVVYSWGVLHHTGHQWMGLDLLAQRVAPRGFLYIALYNHQGWISTYWTVIKKLYVQHSWLRPLLISLHFPYLVLGRYLARKLRKAPPLARGMSLWHDFIDWIGGYPFETSRPEQVLDFLKARRFSLERLSTCGGRHGCNEYLFRRLD